MVTEQEMEELKHKFHDWNHLVRIQCTKPMNVVTRTAELLDGIQATSEANVLRGQ